MVLVEQLKFLIHVTQAADTSQHTTHAPDCLLPVASSTPKRWVEQTDAYLLRIGVDRCQGSSSWDAEAEPVVQPVSPEQLRTVWEALASGRPAPRGIGAEALHGAEQPSSGADNELAVSARMEKQVKQRLTVAADHFNRDYRKGFQYCQVPDAVWSGRPCILAACCLPAIHEPGRQGFAIML